MRAAQLASVAAVALLAPAAHAHAAAATQMRYCTEIARVNGRPVAAIVVAARMPQHRLAAVCAYVEIIAPGNWSGVSGTHLPAGWKVGDVYRNDSLNE